MDACLMGVCLIAAQLTHGSVGHDYGFADTAMSYDGVERSISQFYEPERTTASIGGYAYFDNDVLVELSLDNGYRSQKWNQSRSATIHVSKALAIADKWSVVLSGGTKLGGEIAEEPCRDSYNREYYCGDLTAWSDYSTEQPKDYHMAGITLNYRF